MVNKIKTPAKKLNKDGSVPKKRGPKSVRLQFDDKDLAHLTGMICLFATHEDIVNNFGMSISTINRRLASRGINFAQLYAKKRVDLNMTVRKALIKKVKAGDVASIIYASKNWCGMSDKQEIKQEITVSKTEIYQLPDNGRGD